MYSKNKAKVLQQKASLLYNHSGIKDFIKIKMNNSKLKQLILKNKNLGLSLSDDNIQDENIFLNFAASALNSGIQIIKLQTTNSSPKQIVEIGKKLRELTSLFDALLFITGRIDIAYAIDADGVYLNEDDLCIHTAKDILGDNKTIGVSVSNIEQIENKKNEGADFIAISPELFHSSSPHNIPYFVEIDNKKNIDKIVSLGIKNIILEEKILKDSPNILQKFKEN